MGNCGLINPTSRRILYVAYPLLPVSNESCGGAEQMLSALEAGIAARGHITAVAACAGSKAMGTVFATGVESSEPDRFERRNREHEERILELVRRTNAFDLIHDKSGSFWRSAGEVGVPVLATLHLPRHFYPAEAFYNLPSNLYFACVSTAQAKTFADVRQVLGVVRNGIGVSQFPLKKQKEEYLLWMGRICEEKGAHLAIEVAKRTGLPLVLAGQVYPFTYHQNYYNERIRPFLGRVDLPISFFETPTLDTKIRLLSNARALLVPSLVDETSSLVAMEAMACGTPVIGFRRGAIPEVVIDGRTGYVVNNVDEMTEAVWKVDRIDGSACRRHVERSYSSLRMAREYEELYEELLATRSNAAERRAA